MLKEVKKIVPILPDSIYAGFGNQKSDMIAFFSIEINKDLCFYVSGNKVYQMSGNYSFTFNSLNANIDKLFPDVTITLT